MRRQLSVPLFDILTSLYGSCSCQQWTSEGAIKRPRISWYRNEVPKFTFYFGPVNIVDVRPEFLYPTLICVCIYIQSCIIRFFFLWQSGFCFRQIVESTCAPPPPLLSLKDAPGISPNIIHCYDGDDPRISHPHRAAPSRVQHSAAPSMLGNVQRTALSALLPSSSCEFEKEEPKYQWHPCSTPYSHAISHCS